MNVGDKIKDLRLKRELTQEQLAKDCGLSKNAIWNYENNKRSPSIDILKKIAKALDTNVYNLIDNNDTLTSKLLKLFEETICKGMDSENSLEVLCESIDIDEEVINEALSYNEDISESYLISMIDKIFKFYPNEFYKFYDKNKNFIYSKYYMCDEKCRELETIRDKRMTYIKKLHEKNPLDKQISDLYEKSKSMSLTEEDIENIDEYRKGEIASIKLFDDIDIPRIDGPQNESYELFKKMLKSMKYDINKIETIPLFQKIKKQIELEIEFMNNIKSTK